MTRLSILFALVVATPLVLGGCDGTPGATERSNPNGSKVDTPSLALDCDALVADISAAPEAVQERVDVARAALRDAPEDPRKWVELGMLFEANGPVAYAPPCYLRALELEPDAPRVWYRLAMTRATMALFEESVEALKQVLAHDAGYAPAHWRLGFARIEQGDLEAAEERLREALALDDKDPAAWTLLGRVHLQRDDAEAAASVLEHALTLDQGNLYARGLLGSAYRALGQETRAHQQSALGAGAAADFADPWNRELDAARVPTAQLRLMEAQQLFAAGAPRRAIPIMEELLAEAPDDTTLLNNLGTCYATVRRYPDARRVLEHSLEIEPGQRNTLLNLALLLEKAGEIDEALATVDEALERSPTFAGLHKLRGNLLLQLDEPSQAADAYRRALEYDQRGGDTRMRLGAVELELRRWSDARGTFEALVDAGPVPPDAWVGLAYARTMMGDLDAADAALAEVGGRPVADPNRLRRVRDELRKRRERQNAGGGQ